ncbi:hypothetical protein [Nocardiopsis ansamitocini]|uniref:DUF3558 domain-containing protein n=1 Tax=Nocardiopsis ansamitocini TaxID=1670832 RepID=A0A9W6P2T6_9ACTN|nr:hypothetical protein [Nocardiopsis ansamitocini]GLU46214.1 hypothetical protein Nans01_05650 [Nocardiopsis ansamitocini]
MSDNGPYTQPPQYPGGEGNSGGQPGPYGGAYGQGGQAPGQPDPNAGQGNYPSGPYQAPYGDQGTGGQQPYQGQQPPGGYGSGPYPGQGGPQFQQPHDQQQMFHQGGQPPYGPGGIGYPPPQPPPGPRKSNVGLWVVLAGGLVIVLLIVAVVVVLFTGNNNSETPPVAQESSEAAAPSDPAEPEQGSGGTTTAQGEPPFSVPEDPCAGIPESTLADLGVDGGGTKNISDYSSSCSWSTVVNDNYGTLRVEYKVPYSASDSVESATSDYEYNYEYATDEDGSVFDTKVLENKDLGLGDQSAMIFAEEEIIGVGNRTTVLIRQDNMNIKAEWSVSGSFSGDSDDAPQSFSDVESVMTGIAEDSLALF